MKITTHICLLAFALLLGSAQSLTFPEKVIPLHAPLAGISPDGITAYTEYTYYQTPSSPRNNDFQVIEIYDSVKNEVVPIEIDGKYFDKKFYANFKEKLHTASSVNLIFANPKRTGKSFFTDLRKNMDLYEKYVFGDAFATYDGKYIIISYSTGFVIRDFKTLKPIVDIQKCDESTIDIPHCFPSKVIVNKAMNRLAWLNDLSAVFLYKIDFSHLPKNFEELEKLKIPDALPLGSTLQSLSASPDGSLLAGGFRTEAEVNKKPFYGGWVAYFKNGKVKYYIKSLREEGLISKIAFSYDNKYLATNEYGIIVLRSGKTGKVIKYYTNVYEGNAFAGPFFTKNNKMLYSDEQSNLHIISLP